MRQVMIRRLFTFILCLQLSGASTFAATKPQAAPAPAPEPFVAQKWRGLFYDKGDDIDTSTMVLQRYVSLIDTAYPVSTLTHSVIKRGRMLPVSQAKKEAIELAEGIRKAVNAPEWKVKCYDGQMGRCEFTSDWKKQNRYVQLIYRNLGDRYVFSVSSTRRVYALPVADEAKYLQIILAYREKAKQVSAWNQLKAKFFAFLWHGAEAQAEMVSGTLTIPGLPPITGTFDSNQINGMLGRIEQTGSNLATTGMTFTTQVMDSAVLRANTLVGTTGATVNGVIDRAGGAANGAIDRASGAATGAIDRAGNTASAALNQAHAQGLDLIRETEASAMRVEKQTAEDANALLKRATSFHNVAKTAFAAGFGGTLGAAAGQFVLNFLVDGTVSVVSSLWHGIMGTLSEADKELMRKSVGGAFDDLDKASAELTKIEAEIDKRVAMMALTADMPSGNLAAVVSTAVELQNKQVNDLSRQLDRMPAQSTAAGNCAYTLGRARSNLEVLQNMKAMLGYDEQTRAGVCTKMDSLFRQWASAEARVNEARETISRNGVAILERMTKSFAEAHKESASPRRARNFCKDNISDLEDHAASVQATENCRVRNYQAYRYDPSLPGRRTAFEQNVERECKAYAQRLVQANISSIRQSCDDVVKMESERDHSAGLQNGFMLAQANIEAAKNALAEISRKDCEEGVITGTCDGRAGSFGQLRQRYKTLYAKASQMCGMNLFQPQAYRAAQEPVPIVAPPTQDGGYAASPAAESSDDGGWLGRQFRSLGDFFSGWFD